MEKKELLCTIGRNANWCSHCGNHYGGSSKIKKIELLYGLVITLLGFYTKNVKTLIQKDIYTPIFIVVLQWNQPKCPLIDESIKKICVCVCIVYINIIRILKTHKKELNLAIFSNMDRAREYNAKQNKSEKDKYNTISLISRI